MIRNTKLLIAAGAAFAIAGGVAYILQTDTTPAVAPNSNGDPAIGATLYADNCASCHGADLEGQPDWQSPGEDGVLPAPPHDKTGHSWHHGDGMLFDYTKLGGQVSIEQMGIEGFTSGMPAFGDSLSDAEIKNVLAYIRSTWPERVQEKQATRTEAEQMREN